MPFANARATPLTSPRVAVLLRSILAQIISMVRCPELTTEAYTLLAASLSDGFWRADNL